MIRYRVFALVAALSLTAACTGGGKAKETPSPDTFRLGFSTPSPGVVMANFEVVVDKVFPKSSSVKVDRGTKVEINLLTNVPGELRVQGYEKTLGVRAGIPALLTFTADRAGSFNVELGKSHLHLFRLQVA